MLKIKILYFDINTGYHQDFHHGLAYIIGALTKDKHNVDFIHIKNISEFQYVEKLLSKSSYDLLAISFTTNKKKYVKQFLSNYSIPKTLIIAGGVHCTLVKEAVFKEIPEIDGVCVGEGEVAIRDLTKRLVKQQEYTLNP